MEILSPQLTALSTDPGKSTMSEAEKKALRQACADFEALLNQQLLGTMRDSVFEGEGIFEKSNAEKLFQSMVDQELAEKMATGNNTGLGQMLYSQLVKDAK